MSKIGLLFAMGAAALLARDTKFYDPPKFSHSGMDYGSIQKARRKSRSGKSVKRLRKRK